MAELLTPPKEEDKGAQAGRLQVLERLANLCRDQGSFALACKKFTQAGDKISAFKCLLRSNDTEKIIYYATMTKKRELFILAANYLQNLDWHNEPDIMKTIINFYTKAKALSQLSTFYDACAQVEIDEYRDYEKALGALREALKFVIKAKDVEMKEDRLASLDRRIKLMEKFVEARTLVQRDPVQMTVLCKDLLSQGNTIVALLQHHCNTVVTPL
jgi:intraflagellar transport protein 140